MQLAGACLVAAAPARPCADLVSRGPPPNLQSDFAGQFRAMVALSHRGYSVPEMSVPAMQRIGNRLL
jgi:hypothetical protein